MNQLWVRLTLAFIAVIAGVFVVVASLFSISSQVERSRATDAYAVYFEDATEPFVERYIVAGKEDEEIIALLDTDAQIATLIAEKRAAGFAAGVNPAGGGFGRILTDYMRDLFLSDFLLITLLIGALLGSIASVLFSRQLVRPLSELATATRALGKNDFSQRVNVRGSDEINTLVATFNAMAAQLEHTEKVRQKMLADISHELRTPLTGLEGTLRATLDGVVTLDTAQVSNLHEQTRHLSRLVDDLHLLARAEAHRLTLDKTPTDLAALLRDLMALFRLLAEEAGVSLGEDFMSVPPLNVDAGRIRQVVSNLLNNALRHTPPDGTITLTLEKVSDGVIIGVHDTGEGVSPEHLPYLFDRFYRVDRSRSRQTGGSGLGLAIAKALVEAHGGEISAESKGGNFGTSFLVKLFM